MNYLWVGLGGFCGSVARYAVSCLLASFGKWPIATFSVNVLGSFFLGLLIGFFNNSTMPQHSCYLLCTVGFCGGFTTFSSFSLDTFMLLKEGHYGYAVSYLVLSFICCILATGLGFKWVES